MTRQQVWSETRLTPEITLQSVTRLKAELKRTPFKPDKIEVKLSRMAGIICNVSHPGMIERRTGIGTQLNRTSRPQPMNVLRSTRERPFPI